MFPVGIDICARVSQVVQQVRADALLSTDLEAASVSVKSFKQFTADSLLKDNQEISIPSVSKFADAVGKYLLFEETGSATLKKNETVAAQAAEVLAKITELQAVILEIATKKFTTNFERLEIDIGRLIKGETGDAEASASSLLAQMSAYQPLTKVPLNKILGKSRAEEVERKCHDVTKCVVALKDAFSYLVIMISRDETNEEILADPGLARIFSLLLDEKLGAEVAATLPWLGRTMKQLRGAMISSVCRWLQQTASTCRAFIDELLRPEVDADKFLSRNVLGDLTGLMDVAAGESEQDCKQDQNLVFILHTYVKIVGKEIVDLGGGAKLHAGFLGCAVGLLRLAKYGAVLKDSITAACKLNSFPVSLEAYAKSCKDKKPFVWDTTVSKMKPCCHIFPKVVKVATDFEAIIPVVEEVTGELTGIRSYYKKLKSILNQQIAALTTSLANDISGTRRTMADLYAAVISRHDLAIFKQEVLDKHAVEALCRDDSMQTAALFLNKAERYILDLIALIDDVKGLAAPCLAASATTSLVAATLEDAQRCLAQGADVSSGVKPEVASTTFAHVRFLQANLTVSQALCRELQPGETRIGLVNRCLLLLEKKNSKCEGALHKKAVAVKGK